MDGLILALIAVSIAAAYFAARAHCAERTRDEAWSFCHRLLFDAEKERERQFRLKERDHAGAR
jgi:hypothetical protein